MRLIGTLASCRHNREAVTARWKTDTVSQPVATIPQGRQNEPSLPNDLNIAANRTQPLPEAKQYIRSISGFLRESLQALGSMYSNNECVLLIHVDILHNLHIYVFRRVSYLFSVHTFFAWFCVFFSTPRLPVWIIKMNNFMFRHFYSLMQNIFDGIYSRRVILQTQIPLFL